MDYINIICPLSSMGECFPYKEDVTGSNPAAGTTLMPMAANELGVNEPLCKYWQSEGWEKISETISVYKLRVKHTK